MEFSVADLLSFPESMKVTPGGYNRALYTGHVSLNLCDSWQQRASFFWPRGNEPDSQSLLTCRVFGSNSMLKLDVLG